MGKDILHRVGNGGHYGCETVSREVLPQVEIPEKWTQEPPCFAITIWCAIKIAHQKTAICPQSYAYDEVNFEYIQWASYVSYDIDKLLSN